MALFSENRRSFCGALAQLSPLAHILQEKGDENIINVCKQVDIAYDLELGKTLSEIRA